MLLTVEVNTWCSYEGWGLITFVQNQDFRLAQQSSGKAYQLPLPRGQRRSTLSDWRIEPLRQALYVLPQVGL